MNLRQLERKYFWASLWYDATRWMFIRGRGLAIESLGLAPGNKILEVGCGTGLNFARLASKVGPSGWVVGLDFVRPMLQRASAKAIRLNSAQASHVALVQADGAALPIRESFDAVLFSYSLTMIPEWESALTEAIRVTKPGGRVATLDFSDGRGWISIARRFMVNWLDMNGVKVYRDFPKSFTQSGLSNVMEVPLYGHYVRLVIGTKPA